MDFISDQAFTRACVVGKSALELVRFIKDLLLVPTVQTPKFRNVFKCFNYCFALDIVTSLRLVVLKIMYSSKTFTHDKSKVILY